jgi:hypothetical protein
MKIKLGMYKENMMTKVGEVIVEVASENVDDVHEEAYTAAREWADENGYRFQWDVNYVIEAP